MPDNKKSDKPITITLFYANWCTHCHGFLPVWDKMVDDKKTGKNFRFIKVEEVEIPDLPEEMRMVDGEDVRNIGYPTIKISVNGKEYQYNGRRTARDIYQSIMESLSETEGKLDDEVSVEMNNNNISIESRPLSESTQRGGNIKLRTLSRMIKKGELRL